MCPFYAGAMIVGAFLVVHHSRALVRSGVEYHRFSRSG